MLKKKALIITYYWPPAGGPGVQRWLKFVKYLPEFGVEPIVYVPLNPQYPILDASLVNDVSDDITIIKQPINEPYKLARLFSKKKTASISKGIIPDKTKLTLFEKLLLYVRGNFFIPDARKNWIKPSVRYLNTYISDHNIDVVITTGPPHSLHLIGLQLKEKLGVKWIADFRDPWTSIGYHKQLKLTKQSQLKHKMLENKVLNNADDIIVTSFSTKKEFSAITNRPISIITNGYDIEDIESFSLDTKFSISHIGSLLSKRNPEVLWRAISDLVTENEEFEKMFKLNLIGTVSETVIASIQEYNLSKYLNNTGYLLHNEAIKYQKKSQVLLLVEIDSGDTKSIIPGKLFEYLISKRPIIAIGPKESDVEAIIEETATGQYFNYSDYDELKTTIFEYFIAFKSGNLNVQPLGLEKYSRQALTKKLAKLI